MPAWKLTCAIVLCGIALAQSQSTLDVASVKLSRNAVSDSNVDSVRGRLTASNITVKELIRLAYGVSDYQIARTTKWVESQRFDIVAKSAGDAAGLEGTKALVRELLADRFQLRLHRETKQMTVYLLVVAKDGLKLTPHDNAGPLLRGGCGRLVGAGG
ncbi:MAG: TIGR03435 family protein [Ignavibacteriota bacterium]